MRVVGRRLISPAAAQQNARLVQSKTSASPARSSAWARLLTRTLGEWADWALSMKHTSFAPSAWFAQDTALPIGPSCCLGDNCPYSAEPVPVGSRQLRLGEDSGQCGLVLPDHGMRLQVSLLVGLVVD